LSNLGYYLSLSSIPSYEENMNEITPEAVATLLMLDSGSLCNEQVQVFSMEEGVTQGGLKKFMLIISDGVCLLGCGVAPPLFHLFEGNDVTKHTIVTINQVAVPDIGGCSMVIILNMVHVSHHEKVIGDPTFGSNDKSVQCPPLLLSFVLCI
jgi:hypothetical protein